MPERITRDDLNRALASHADALAAVGISYDGRLALDIGSKTYGNAYRLNRIPSGSSAHHRPPVGDSYLGMTARDAYDNLTTRTAVLYDVAQLQRQQ